MSTATGTILRMIELHHDGQENLPLAMVWRNAGDPTTKDVPVKNSHAVLATKGLNGPAMQYSGAQLPAGFTLDGIKPLVNATRRGESTVERSTRTTKDQRTFRVITYTVPVAFDGQDMSLEIALVERVAGDAPYAEAQLKAPKAAKAEKATTDRRSAFEAL
jgi:hypothetical protein